MTERTQERKFAAPHSDSSNTQKHDASSLERKNQQLTRENEELRKQCSFFDQTAKNNRKLAAEWQSFGRYTASVLKKEMETNEAKLKLLEEQLKKLTSENKELREMCLYLDRSHEDSEVKLTPPESTELLVHTRILAELNKRGGGIIPQYRGVTSQSTLKDDGRGGSKRSMRDPLHISGGVDPKVAVAEMKKRMDQLEREKLELIKSLSAAHLLAANTPAHPHPSGDNQSSSSSMYSSLQTTPDLPPVDTPPDLASYLRRSGPHQSGQRDPPQTHTTSLDTITAAVALLDVCRRLDAADINGYANPQDEMEAASLRVLLGIAWQKIQQKAQEESRKRDI